MSHCIPVALTIAGSDCSAGAGIQADLKTFQHFQVHGLTAITCVVAETAHVVHTGLDPSDEMAFALAHDKLASVHLNDQNGLKYDQDKNFGSANLRAAFNQVRVLEEAGYGSRGEFIGLDVKTMRTQAGSPVTAHLTNSREIFLWLVDKYRSLDHARVAELRDARDYEALELHIIRHLLGI